MKKVLVVALASLVLTPSVSEAKQPTNLKGYIKVAQKAYPTKCNGKIKVRWDVRTSDLRKCEISLEREWYRESDREWRCRQVVVAVGQQLAGESIPALPKACSPPRRKGR